MKINFKQTSLVGWVEVVPSCIRHQPNQQKHAAEMSINDNATRAKQKNNDKLLMISRQQEEEESKMKNSMSISTQLAFFISTLNRWDFVVLEPRLELDINIFYAVRFSFRRIYWCTIFIISHFVIRSSRTVRGSFDALVNVCSTFDWWKTWTIIFKFSSCVQWPFNFSSKPFRLRVVIKR